MLDNSTDSTRNFGTTHQPNRREIKRQPAPSELNMTASSQHTPRYVVCVDNKGYGASLELHKIYRSVPDADAAKAGDLRVVDESGEDYLFPARMFEQISVPKRVHLAFEPGRHRGGKCRTTIPNRVNVDAGDGRSSWGIVSARPIRRLSIGQQQRLYAAVRRLTVRELWTFHPHRPHCIIAVVRELPLSQKEARS